MLLAALKIRRFSLDEPNQRFVYRFLYFFNLKKVAKGKATKEAYEMDPG